MNSMVLALARPDAWDLRSSIGVQRILQAFNWILIHDFEDEMNPWSKNIGHRSLNPDVKYDGRDDQYFFESWLTTVLSHLDEIRLNGDGVDRDHIRRTVQFMESDALIWYQKAAGMSRGRTRVSSFKESIVGLYERFIKTDHFDNAQREFEQIWQYESKKGVEGPYDMLMDCAERMYQTPADYDVALRFQDELLNRIFDVLFVSRGYGLRQTGLEKIVTAAIELLRATR